MERKELVGELANIKKLLGALESELGVIANEEDRLLEFLEESGADKTLIDETRKLQSQIAKILEDKE
ncbi:hypothetical protein AGMMS50229_12490 [Campylobacterota bacterium]|nr:hypothetical protein AGMMS50229_12490 [Campylobacterota bacterium]